jgi:hypothetical protein
MGFCQGFRARFPWSLLPCLYHLIDLLSGEAVETDEEEKHSLRTGAEDLLHRIITASHQLIAPASSDASNAMPEAGPDSPSRLHHGLSSSQFPHPQPERGNRYRFTPHGSCEQTWCGATRRAQRQAMPHPMASINSLGQQLDRTRHVFA